MAAAHGGVQLLQIGKFGQADDLDARAVKELVVPGQEDAGAVHLGRDDLGLGKVPGGVEGDQVGFFRDLGEGDGKLRHSRSPLSYSGFALPMRRGAALYSYFHYSLPAGFCT